MGRRELQKHIPGYRDVKVLLVFVSRDVGVSAPLKVNTVGLISTQLDF